MKTVGPMHTTPPPGSDRAADPGKHPNPAAEADASGDAATDSVLRRLSILRPPRAEWIRVEAVTEGSDPGPCDGAAPEEGIDDGLLVALRTSTLDETSEASLIQRLLAEPAARDLLMGLAVAPGADAFAEAEAVRPHRGAALARNSPSKRLTVAPGLRQQRSARFALLAGIATVAVLAASLAIWMGRGAQPEVPPPHTLELTGGIAATRAGGSESDTFVPTSMLTLRIAPLAPSAEGEPTLIPSIFAGPPEGPLVAVPSDLLSAGAAGVWRLRTPAGRILQGPSGPRVILVGLAPSPLDVGGQSVAGAQAAHPEARWHLQHLTWRAEAPSAPEAPR